ncbi:MAG: S8 family serine peptidase, partial [Blastocatellia bacterium]
AGQTTLPKPKLAPDLAELLALDDARAKTGKGRARTLAGRRGENLQRQVVNGVTLPSENVGPGEKQSFIVQLGETGSAAAMRAKVASLGGVVRQAHGNMGLVTIEAPRQVIRRLAAEGSIAYVSPDRSVHASKSGHAEETTGALAVREYLGKGTLEGEDIGLAVIDSGVDSAHKLLIPAGDYPGVIYNRDFTGSGISGDPYGHGTHVASMAAGGKKLSGGLYRGLAPATRIINLRVLNDQGQGAASAIIAALDWCIANKAAQNLRVINMSLGTIASDSWRRDPLCLAARRAHNAGIVVVAAAGNDGKDVSGRKIYGAIHSPGIDPSVITVGAANTFGTTVRSDDQVTTFSSRGPTRGYVIGENGNRVYDNLIKPDLVAPGNKIIGASSSGPGSGRNRLRTENPRLTADLKDKVNPEESLMFLSGTSISAPIVAGAAALLLQANPALTPNLVKAILMYTAQPLAGANMFEQGAGLLNVEGAVRVATMVRTPLPTANGAELLTAALPGSQTSVIAGQTVTWGQGVITDWGFLHGKALMTKWQGAYASGAVLADATDIANGAFGLAAGWTSAGVSLKSGAVSISGKGAVLADGVVIADGVILADGVALADGVVMGDGVILADGAILADGTVLADVRRQSSIAARSVGGSLLGDDTDCMQPEP